MLARSAVGAIAAVAIVASCGSPQATATPRPASPSLTASPSLDTTPVGTLTPAPTAAATYSPNPAASISPTAHQVTAGGTVLHGFSDPHELYVTDGYTITQLKDGRLLLLGGMQSLQGGGRRDADEASILDPFGGTVRKIGTMTSPRVRHVAALLPDGRVLVAGGDAWQLGARLSSAEVYDPATNTFTPTGSMAMARYDARAVTLNDGRVLIAGGYDDRHFVGGAEVFDPGTGTFTTVREANPLISGWIASSLTLLPDGRALLLSTPYPGTSGEFRADVFDPSTGGFRPIGAATKLESAWLATALRDGRVLVIGSNAYLFDPKTDSFKGLRDPGMDAFVSVLRADGAVLLLGYEAKKYVPSNGYFMRLNAKAPARFRFGIALPDGYILLAGSTHYALYHI